MIFINKEWPIVVNLYGAPGSGKSTLAAAVFADQKQRGRNCELITEFAKDLTWENNQIALANQAYVFGNQYYRMTRCAWEVDILITDSPLLLSILYLKRSTTPANALIELALSTHQQFDNLDYFLEGAAEYDPCGRNESAEEAHKLSFELESTLDRLVWAYPIKPFKKISNRDVTMPTILACINSDISAALEKRKGGESDAESG